MTTITTRSGKGSPLTNNEVDANFTNLNDDKVEASGDSMTGNLSFGDNNKVILGAGSDLQIYHDASDGKSYIRETGSGNFEIRATNLRLKDATGGNYLAADFDGAVTAYYDGSARLATTSTGIDVTGVITSTGIDVTGSISADGLEVEAATPVLEIDSTTSANLATLQFTTSGTVDSKITHQASSGDMVIESGRNSTWGGKIYLKTDTFQNAVFTRTTSTFNENSADIDFRVESNSKTHMLFVDAGNNYVGIAESSPDALLHINATSNGNFQEAIRLTNAGGGSNEGAFIRFEVANTDGHGAIIGARRSGLGGIDLRFDTGEINGAPVTAMTIDHDQNVGIGVGAGSITSLLHVGGNILSESSSTLNTTIRATGNNTRAIGNYQAHDSSGNDVNMSIGVFGDVPRGELSTATNHTLRLYVNNTPSKYLEIATTGQVFTSHGLIVNEDSNDSDFRVESNGSTHMLYVDAGNNRVGINDTSPDFKLDVLAGNGDQFRLNNGGERFTQMYWAHNNVSKGAIWVDGTDSSFAYYAYSGMDANFYSNAQKKFSLRDNKVVVNEDSHDVDFRVESDSYANMLFMDAGLNRLGIATGSPAQTVDIGVGGLQIQGNIAAPASGTSAMQLDYIGGATRYWSRGANATTRGTHDFYVLENDAGNQLLSLQLDNTGGAIFNEQSADADFRVESNNNTHMLFVDAGNDTTFVNLTGPVNSSNASLQASGTANPAALFNRTNDGDIVTFHYNGGGVLGRIRSRSSGGNLELATSQSGIDFGGDGYLPMSGTNITDNAIDIGSSSYRYADLHLSTNIHQGATTPSSSAAGISSEAVGRATYSRGSGTGGFAHLTFINGNGTIGSVVTSGYATAYNTSSDYRLKENVVALTGATARLNQLAPKRFNFIGDTEITVDGFLAHEVADVVPEAITGAKDAMRDEEYEVTPAVLDDDGYVVTEAVMGTRSVPDYQGIDQSKLVPLLVATIQELEARIAALESN